MRWLAYNKKKAPVETRAGTKTNRS
jgi:hypothetical protein